MFKEIAEAAMDAIGLKKDTALDRAVAKRAKNLPLEEDEFEALNAKAVNTEANHKGLAPAQGGEAIRDLAQVSIFSGQFTNEVRAEILAQELGYNLGNCLMAMVKGDLRKARAYLETEIRREDILHENAAQSRL